MHLLTGTDVFATQTGCQSLRPTLCTVYLLDVESSRLCAASQVSSLRSDEKHDVDGGQPMKNLNIRLLSV